MNHDEAIRYLTHDESGEDTGGLSVPCSRWGRNGADCAEVAYDLATVYADASGEPIDQGSLEHCMSLVVNDHDDVGSLLYEHGSDEIRERYEDELAEYTPQYVDAARALGREAAENAASWVEMSVPDARSILDDIDPAVLDRYPGPNLSGEWADDLTPASLYRAITGEDVPSSWVDTQVMDAIADAWEQAADERFSELLGEIAARVVEGP